MSSTDMIIHAIDNAPLNRGLSGRAWIEREGNVPVVIGDNVALFDGCGGNTYEGHFLFVSRGRLAIMARREAFRRMFEDHGAETIFGLIPDFRRDAKLLVRWAGGKFAGKRDTSEGPCDLFVISKDMWQGIDQ